MTLRQALISLNLRIGHPDCLANLQIKNYEGLCIIALMRYFQSSQFSKDLESAEDNIIEGCANGYDDFVILIVKDPETGEYRLKVDLDEYYQDSIETYQ